MQHTFIRVLAVGNLVMMGFAFLVVPVMLLGSLNQSDPAKKNLGLLFSAWAGAYLVLYGLSGWGLWKRQRWSRGVTLALGGVLFAEGIWHMIRWEWGMVVFCLPYAALIGWLLIPRHSVLYFGDEVLD